MFVGDGAYRARTVVVVQVDVGQRRQKALGPRCGRLVAVAMGVADVQAQPEIGMAYPCRNGIYGIVLLGNV